MLEDPNVAAEQNKLIPCHTSTGEWKPARLAWETCTSMIMDCSELDGIPGCGEEFKAYYKNCRLP